MRMPVVLAGLAVAGVATAFGVRQWSAPGAAAGATSAAMLHVVERADMTVTLIENGTLVAKDSQKISAGTDGSGKITFIVEEGRQVAQDEVLARLDTKDLETDIEQLRLDIVQGDADLNTARTELEIQLSENTATTEKAAIALDRAQKELERYQDGDAPSERRKLEVAIKQAETEYSHAKKKAADSQALFDKTYITKSQLEQDQIDFERKDVELTGAGRDLQIFEKYTLPMTTEQKDVAVGDAQRDKENTEKRASATTRQKEVAVEQAAKSLAMKNKRLGKQLEELDKMTIKAPHPGIVLYGDPNQPWYRNNIRLGGEVWGEMVLFTLPDLRVMQVKLQVHEADINKLKEGLTAKVTMDTYPGLVLDGEVTKVADIAGNNSDRGNDPEVKKFDVKVTLKGSEELKLKPGISAKAEIFIGRLAQVVAVPLQCVFEEEGSQFCWVQGADGIPKRVAVKTGQSN
ncbi:MAG TPA: efflux RND transporter periplasmic adaptor subunit, partial [Planctomycetota bacterium]|nr:efflux RND transporter periplasmic adaptor subunit [Planctomycetota bacterium]